MGCSASKKKEPTKTADEETPSQVSSSANATPSRQRPSGGKEKRTPKRDGPSRQNSGSGAFSKVGKNAPLEKPWKKNNAPRERTVSLDETASPTKGRQNKKEQEEEAVRAKDRADFEKRRAKTGGVTKPKPPTQLLRGSDDGVKQNSNVLSPTARARVEKMGLDPSDPKAQRFVLTEKEEQDEASKNARDHTSAMMKKSQEDWAKRMAKKQVDAEGRPLPTETAEFHFATDDLHARKPARVKGEADAQRTDGELAAARVTKGREQAYEENLRQRELFEARQAKGQLATQPQEFHLETAARARPSTLQPTDYGDNFYTAAHQKAASAAMREEASAVNAAEADAYAKRMGRANPKSPTAAWNSGKTPKAAEVYTSPYAYEDNAAEEEEEGGGSDGEEGAGAGAKSPRASGGTRLSREEQAKREKNAREEQSALAAKEKAKFERRMAKRKAGGQ